VGRTFGGLAGAVACWMGLVLGASVASCDGTDDSPARSPGSAGSGGVGADSALPDAPLGGSSGTGGASSDGAVPGVRDACIAWCEKQAEAACPGGTPREQCPGACDLLTPDISCAKEYAATADCIRSKARFACLSPGRVEMYGCWGDIGPYLVCAACLPATNDDACDTCTKTTCCEQRKAYYSHPDLGPFTDCVGDCGGQDAGSACTQACGARFPELQATVRALTDCISTCLTTCR
jgi:hypothetical protein